MCIICIHIIQIMHMKAISSRRAAFVRDVARAAFANPFSEERGALDRALAGSAHERSGQGDAERMMAAVTSEIEALEREGAADIRRHDGDTREALRVAFLFDAFHRFLRDLDRHIEEQMRVGDAPAPVPFARDALALLARRGFSSEASVRYLGVFFQMRRAYYFIARGLTGASPCMRRFRERLWQNVFTRDIRHYDLFLADRMEDFSTLLLGETGTGKGAAAAAIGRSGFIPFDPRTGCFKESFTRAFIAVNLSQFPEPLIESELFGHRKGAFTGATDHHAGVFARGSPHGAIFLDEIGDASVPMQLKLLRVLQERTFTPVGGHETLRFEGRVIAATNKRLDALRRTGAFRDDFYYRLCSDVIEVPTLRERLREDAKELDALVLAIVARVTGDEALELATEVTSALRRQPGPDYAWPGNVRELEQAVRRVLLTGAYAPGTDRSDTAEMPSGWRDGTWTAAELLATYCRRLYDRFGSYEEVARRTGLDRRTVKRHILGEQSATR